MDYRTAIQKAEHALRTNQPNLATLYMKRASELLTEAFPPPPPTLTEIMAKIGKEISEAFTPILEGTRIAFNLMAKSIGQLEQKDYALVR